MAHASPKYAPGYNAERGLAMALVQEHVWLIEKCDEGQIQFHKHFASLHTIGMVFAK